MYVNCKLYQSDIYIVKCKLYASIIIKCHFSVMEKLPATSYVRLVDIWLISIQLVPFLLVVMTTASELFLEDSEETDINHHGMAR